MYCGARKKILWEFLYLQNYSVFCATGDANAGTALFNPWVEEHSRLSVSIVARLPTVQVIGPASPTIPVPPILFTRYLFAIRHIQILLDLIWNISQFFRILGRYGDDDVSGNLQTRRHQLLCKGCARLRCRRAGCSAFSRHVNSRCLGNRIFAVFPAYGTNSLVPCRACFIA